MLPKGFLSNAKLARVARSAAPVLLAVFLCACCCPEGKHPVNFTDDADSRADKTSGKKKKKKAKKKKKKAKKKKKKAKKKKEADFFAAGGASAVIGEVKNQFGEPLYATEVVFYPSYAILELENPKIPGNVDRYTYRNGKLDSGRPVRLSSRDRKRLPRSRFDVSELALSEIPAMITLAREKMGIPDGKVSHIIVDRFTFNRKKVSFRVYVSSERESGYMVANADGSFVEIVK